MESDNQKWLEEIYEEYAPMVLRYAKSLYRSFPWLPYEAEDIVQETFLCLYENRERIYDKEGIAGWLLKAARNKTFDYGSEQKRRFKVIDDYAGVDEIADIRETEEEETLDLEYYMELCRERIGRKNFEMMQECCMEHGAIEKVAEREGIRAGTLRVRLHRWKKICAEVIKNAAWIDLSLILFLWCTRR